MKREVSLLGGRAPQPRLSVTFLKRPPKLTPRHTARELYDGLYVTNSQGRLNRRFTEHSHTGIARRSAAFIIRAIMLRLG
jgi:hypothetical protein